MFLLVEGNVRAMLNTLWSVQQSDTAIALRGTVGEHASTTELMLPLDSLFTGHSIGCQIWSIQATQPIYFLQRSR